MHNLHDCYYHSELALYEQERIWEDQEHAYDIERQQHRDMAAVSAEVRDSGHSPFVTRAPAVTPINNTTISDLLIVQRAYFGGGKYRSIRRYPVSR